MSYPSRKTKIVDSDSEDENSTTYDESDDYLVNESDCEDTNTDSDNALNTKSAQIDGSDRESEDSCNESDVPLSIRLSNLLKDF